MATPTHPNPDADTVLAEGAGLHMVRVDQMPMSAVVTAQAAASELADPAYRNELTRWTNRPPWSGDGDGPAGWPAARIGYATAATELPPVPRRDATEVIAHGTTNEPDRTAIEGGV